MKTKKNIYQLVYGFSNLLLAAKKAQKGKRRQKNVSFFNFNLEKKLLFMIAMPTEKEKELIKHWTGIRSLLKKINMS